MHCSQQHDLSKTFSVFMSDLIMFGRVCAGLKANRKLTIVGKWINFVFSLSYYPTNTDNTVFLRNMNRHTYTVLFLSLWGCEVNTTLTYITFIHGNRVR